jgi:AcrR family transcriptional regulator
MARPWDSGAPFGEELTGDERSCFSWRVNKGEETRLAILDRAVDVARVVGLGGLTIGTLAERTQLSKSGLFGHFRSKEALQLAVLEHGRADFEADVVRPALRAARGEPRLRTLFERWLAWDARPGGCPFAAASFELDDQPGPVRDALVRDQRDLFDAIATIVRSGIAEGQLRPDADPEQFAQDLNGVVLGCHFTKRLLGDERAEERAYRAFEALLADARA